MNKEQTLTGVIRGTGACVPKRVMDNDEIAGFVETSDEWIRERTDAAFGASDVGRSHPEG